MWQNTVYPQDKSARYHLIERQLSALLEGESNAVANMANMSALLYTALESVNWVGFYLRRGRQLVLGPFQGLPACIRIPFGRGVCGTAAEQGKTQLVRDVHAFPGHIACDGASKSELVIPLFQNGDVIGVLDIDSPVEARFDEEDAGFMEFLVQRLAQVCLWEEGLIKKHE